MLLNIICQIYYDFENIVTYSSFCLISLICKRFNFILHLATCTFVLRHEDACINQFVKYMYFEDTKN